MKLLYQNLKEHITLSLIYRTNLILVNFIVMYSSFKSPVVFEGLFLLSNGFYLS